MNVLFFNILYRTLDAKLPRRTGTVLKLRCPVKEMFAGEGCEKFIFETALITKRCIVSTTWI